MLRIKGNWSGKLKKSVRLFRYQLSNGALLSAGWSCSIPSKLSRIFQIDLPDARQLFLWFVGQGCQMAMYLLEARAISVGKDHGYAAGQKSEAVPACSARQIQGRLCIAGKYDFLHVMRKE